MVRVKPILVLIVCAEILGAGLSLAQSSKVIGSWKVEITFANGDSRSLRFESRESGKGSFLLLDPKLKVWGPAKPLEAKWTQNAEGSIMISGAVEFPLGNVGRDAGTLVLKGKFGTEGSISGEAAFFPIGLDPTDPKSTPAKRGTFKAVRVTGG